jgi:hypothetical protein
MQTEGGENMKSELERYKDALTEIKRHLGNTGWSYEYVLTVVTDVLNPPPIMEEVEEIVGWVNVYRYHDGRYEVGETLYPKEDDANGGSGPFRISCQPIKVSVQREKKRPVERSAEVMLSKELWVIETTGDELPAEGFTGTLTWKE